MPRVAPKVESEVIVHRVEDAVDDETGSNDNYPQCLLDESGHLAGHQGRDVLVKDSDLVEVEDSGQEDQPRYFTHKDAPQPKHPVFRQELDESSILNANITDESYIDTSDLAERILCELKQYSIPQTLFAERILCRSQGTLSDLLRNPRPWSDMKSGKDTYRRMFNWLQQPLHIRLSILNLYDLNGAMSGTAASTASGAPAKRHHPVPGATAAPASAVYPAAKRTRFIFTERQKSTLTAIFRETPRVSKEMQDKIAERLGLDSQTVGNFFMNARRRTKITTGAQRKSTRATRPPKTYADYDQDFDEVVHVADANSVSP